MVDITDSAFDDDKGNSGGGDGGGDNGDGKEEGSPSSSANSVRFKLSREGDAGHGASSGSDAATGREKVCGLYVAWGMQRFLFFVC